MEDLEAEWVLTAGINGSTLYNWTTTVSPKSDVFGGSSDFNCTQKHPEGNTICWEHPEEMLNPAKRNPIFYEIVITHAVTFIVGKYIIV